MSDVKFIWGWELPVDSTRFPSNYWGTNGTNIFNDATPYNHPDGGGGSYSLAVEGSANGANYVQTADDSQVTQGGTKKWTVHTCFKSDNWVAGTTIFGVRSYTANDNLFVLKPTTGGVLSTLAVLIAGETMFTTGPQYVANRWNRMVAEYDGGSGTSTHKINLYMNGTHVGGGTFTKAVTSTISGRIVWGGPASASVTTWHDHTVMWTGWNPDYIDEYWVDGVAKGSEKTVTNMPSLNGFASSALDAIDSDADAKSLEGSTPGTTEMLASFNNSEWRSFASGLTNPDVTGAAIHIHIQEAQLLTNNYVGIGYDDEAIQYQTLPFASGSLPVKGAFISGVWESSPTNSQPYTAADIPNLVIAYKAD